MKCKLQIDDRKEYVRLCIEGYDQHDQNEGDLIYKMPIDEVSEVLENLTTHQIMNSSLMTEKEYQKFSLMINELSYFLYDTQERIAIEEMIGGENKPL